MNGAGESPAKRLFSTLGGVSTRRFQAFRFAPAGNLSEIQNRADFQFGREISGARPYWAFAYSLAGGVLMLDKLLFV